MRVWPYKGAKPPLGDIVPRAHECYRPLMRPIHIVPSILAADFTRLGDEITRADAAGADRFHLDVMDGHVVKNLSFGPDVIRAMRPLTSKPFEVHLMVTPARDWLAALKNAGSDRILIHARLEDDLAGILNATALHGMKAGLVLTPDDPAECVRPHLNHIDYINVLTVKPGFGGQAFMTDMMPKVSALRALIGERAIDLAVDGGVKLDTVPLAAYAGANVFIAGTGIYSGDPERYADTINAMRQAALAAYMTGD